MIRQLSVPIGIKQFFIDFRPQFGGKLTTQLLVDFAPGCTQIIGMFLAYSVDLLTYPNQECQNATCHAHEGGKRSENYEIHVCPLRRRTLNTANNIAK